MPGLEPTLGLRNPVASGEHELVRLQAARSWAAALQQRRLALARQLNQIDAALAQLLPALEDGPRPVEDDGEP